MMIRKSVILMSLLCVFISLLTVDAVRIYIYSSYINGTIILPRWENVVLIRTAEGVRGTPTAARSTDIVGRLPNTVGTAASRLTVVRTPNAK